jgi:hypothetical protein
MLESSLADVGHDILGSISFDIMTMTDEEALDHVRKSVMENPFRAIASTATNSIKEYEVFRDDPETKKMVDEMMNFIEEIKVKESQGDGVLLIEEQDGEDDGNDGNFH